MFKPELYKKTNSIPRKDSSDSLLRYGSKIRWGIGDSIIDLGCGDGSVTVEVLRKFLPVDFARLVGCDIGERMVEHANLTYGDHRTSFTVLDVVSELPSKFKASFNHVFSFYAIHWMQDQEKVFENIHKLLVEDGDCLVVFLGTTLVFDFYRALARHPKWKFWFKDVEKYISPYQDLQEPEKRVHCIMADIGFNNIDVKCEKKLYIYEENHFRDTMEAICPYKIPAELMEEFMDDYVQVARDLNATEEVDGRTIVKMKYSLIIAYGSK